MFKINFEKLSLPQIQIWKNRPEFKTEQFGERVSWIATKELNLYTPAFLYSCNYGGFGREVLETLTACGNWNLFVGGEDLYGEGDFFAMNAPKFDINQLPKADILIWRFYDAPEEIRYSVGGDEDWVALVEKKFYDENHIPFLDSGGYSSIGVCDVTLIDADNHWLCIG